MKGSIAVWLGLVFCLLFNGVSAGTVEIFLLKAQEETLLNLDLAREQDHQIVYYYLDAEQAIEADLTNQLSALPRLLAQVTDSLTQAERAAMSEDELTQQVMALLANDTEAQRQLAAVQSMANDVNTREALISAEQDKAHAKARGVLMTELPAIYFNGAKFPNTTDLADVGTLSE